MAGSNPARNNLVASATPALNMTQSETGSLLSSPHNFLSELTEEEARHVRSVLIPAYQNGFRIIFIVGAALAAAAFLLAMWLMPQVALKREDDEKLKEEGRQRIMGTQTDEDNDIPSQVEK